MHGLHAQAREGDPNPYVRNWPPPMSGRPIAISGDHWPGELRLSEIEAHGRRLFLISDGSELNHAR